MSDNRCIAETKVKRGTMRIQHTLRCQKDAGHEGAHEVKDEARTVLWFGEARKLEDDTRFRFGFWPGWLNS